VASGREFDDEADDDFGEIDPEHPALRRVQEALKAQILKQKTRLSEDIRQKVVVHPHPLFLPSFRLPLSAAFSPPLPSARHSIASRGPLHCALWRGEDDDLTT
jgi:hypothetical protein